MNKIIPEETELRKKYIEENKPMHLIANEMEMSVGKIYKYIKLYGIPTRNQKETFTMKGHKLTSEQRKRISERNKGRTLSLETRGKISEAHKKGGIGFKKERSDGYISIYFPDHPCSSSDGYIMEHILVMECLIGRHLKPDECVHHINHNRKDNRKENLQLMTKSEHMSYHSKKRWEEYRNVQ